MDKITRGRYLGEGLTPATLKNIGCYHCQHNYTLLAISLFFFKFPFLSKQDQDQETQ